MEKDNSVLGLSGLINISNTCYLNSILQTLFNNKYIIEYFLNNKCVINNKFKNNLIHELEKLVKNIWKENSTILPKSFIELLGNIVKEDLNEQNDPDEYYEKIITQFYEETCIINDNIDNSNISNKEWNKYFNNKFSYINDIYYGQYKSETVCNICQNEIFIYEPFITIKLELIDNHLLNCLKKHLSWENDIDFICEKCKKSCKTKKRFTLIKLPKIMIFTLKRYNNLMQKNSNHIIFPFLFEIDNNKYELTSIINHYGFCLEMGHYISYCKNNIDNKWYKFDDKSIDEIDINTINTNNIYMLIYNLI